MKKILSLILILLLAFSVLKANAVTLSEAEVKEAIAKQVSEKYKEYTDAELKVQVLALPFTKLELPNGKVSFVVESNSKKFMARDLEKVLVYVNDKFITMFNAPVLTKAYQNVLVASCPIQREKPINLKVVTVEKREISNNMQYLLTESYLSKEIMAKKFFAQGEVIDKRYVKLKPDILRNSNVIVLFNSNTLTVSTEAIALSDGVIGENICLMNKHYNKIYTGKVIGENKVLVQI